MANFSVTQILRRVFNSLTDRLKVEVGASTLPTGAATESTLSLVLARLLQASEVSASNSSTTPLGSSGVFTGSWIDALDYAMVSVDIKSDQASATDGLSIEWSKNGSTAIDTDKFAISANAGKQFTFGITSQYFRVVYTNGSVAQGSFELSTVLHRSGRKASSHRVIDSIVDEDDAELIKSVLTGRTRAGSYRNVKVDDEGALIITDSGDEPGISFGDVFTTVATQVAVRRTAYTEPTSNAQRSVSSSSANDTAAGTGARTIRLTYLGSSGVGPFTETITLNGVTPVDTVATDICFIEKIEVLTAGSTGSNVGVITLFGSTGGAGGTVGTIGATANKTFWAHHYVASGVVVKITAISGNNDNSTPANGSRFVFRKLPIGVADAVEEQISDSFWVQGQSPSTTRRYASPIQVSGPARVTAYVTPTSGANITHYIALDYFEI